MAAIKPRCGACGVYAVGSVGAMCSDCRNQIKKGTDNLLGDLKRKPGK